MKTDIRRLTYCMGLVGVAAAAAVPSLALGRDGVNQRVSLRSDGTEANGRSAAPVITPDAVWIAFSSEATNLIVGDTNGSIDVFVHNRISGKTVRVSVGSGGVQGSADSGTSFSDTDGGRPAAITPNGRFVVFHSKANNLVDSDINTSDGAARAGPAGPKNTPTGRAVGPRSTPAVATSPLRAMRPPSCRRTSTAKPMSSFTPSSPIGSSCRAGRDLRSHTAVTARADAPTSILGPGP